MLCCKGCVSHEWMKQKKLKIQGMDSFLDIMENKKSNINIQEGCFVAAGLSRYQTVMMSFAQRRS